MCHNTCHQDIPLSIHIETEEDDRDDTWEYIENHLYVEHIESFLLSPFSISLGTER